MKMTIPVGNFTGLQEVSQIEYSSGTYEFDTRVVWRCLKDGTLWTARDSGCSCPTPFENTNELDRVFSIDALREEYVADEEGFVTREGWERFRDAVQSALLEMK